MSRLINDGPDPSVVKRVICKNCGATMEYVPADVMSKTVHDYGGGSEDYRYIICLKCLDPIYL